MSTVGVVGEVGFKQWELAVDSISDLLILVDCEGKIVRANRAVERWGLASVVSVPGMEVHRLIHRHCEDPSCYLVRLHLNKTRRVEAELHDPELDRWVHMTLEPLTKGETPCRLLTVHDITELRHQRLREGRRTRFEALHIVARNLAHEIGNPLAAMRTTTEVLAENIGRFDSTKVDAYLGRVLEGTERLQNIVERTLRDHQFTELSNTVFPLDTLLRRMYRLFQDEVASRGIHLEYEHLSSTGLLALADMTAAEEVLINVLRNALDATSAGGSIHLSGCSEAERVSVVVRDTGRGMGRHQLANIFQPFFTTKAEGTGIGLSYSSYLMRKMGGTIGLDSKIDQGTTVTLEFPAGISRQVGELDEQPRATPDC